MGIAAWPCSTATCSAWLHLGGLGQVGGQACSGRAQTRPPSPHTRTRSREPLHTPPGLPPGPPTALVSACVHAQQVCTQRLWMCTHRAQQAVTWCLGAQSPYHGRLRMEKAAQKMHGAPGTHTRGLMTHLVGTVIVHMSTGQRGCEQVLGPSRCSAHTHTLHT